MQDVSLQHSHYALEELSGTTVMRPSGGTGTCSASRSMHVQDKPVILRLHCAVTQLPG